MSGDQHMRNTVTLRPATLADLRTVASWNNSTRDCELWAGWRVKFPIDLEALPKAVEFGEDNAFSLYSTAGLIGFAQLIRRNSNRGHLSRVIVSPLHRRQGYGETLVRQLIEEARARRYSQMSLNVDTANDGAIALYLKLGFRHASRPADEPVSPSSYYMELDLSTAHQPA